MKIIRLLKEALRQTGAAQHIKTVPTRELLGAMVASSKVDWAPDLATARTCVRLACLIGRTRTDFLDSCIIRSLAFAALVKAHPQVTLHIGFRHPADTDITIDGHAWVTVNDEYGMLDGLQDSPSAYTIASSISLDALPTITPNRG